MASQNINQYVKPNLYPLFSLESYDMSLTSDERDFNQEVVFSPYLIAQTYGNRLPFYFDINNTNSAQNLTLNYKEYNRNNIFVSENYYNPDNIDFSCVTSGTSCDIGLTGIDNGLVTGMTAETITFTNGLLPNNLKFDRMNFDRRLKLFQVTGNTSEPNIRFSGFPDRVLYEVVSKFSPFEGRYHELYGGFYQGFYRLFGYDYEIFPERMNKGWTVEMILKPRLVNEYEPTEGETTLNKIYPNNKNTFFYFGGRAENKFYHHADGTQECYTGYTRVTSGLTKLETCACCNTSVTNSRCIYVYPPRSANGVHDPHVNYGCDLCGGNREKQTNCGCDCNSTACETCGWECQTHICPTPSPTPTQSVTPTPSPTSGLLPTITPTPTPSSEVCDIIKPVCTPTCTKCETCTTCDNCTSGWTSIENTCETDPSLDANGISFRLCGDPKNPQIGVRAIVFTGQCETTGTCSNTGSTYVTGYTIVDYCSPPIYPYCLSVNPAYLEDEHWFQLDAVWERYTWLDTCDLWYRGGLGNITEKVYLEGLANNATSLITTPYTQENGKTSEQIELVNLNSKWFDEKKYRKGRLKFYINGKLFYTIEDFEEIIPRALSTDKEKQVGVPFNVSWGGGTQGLRENLTFSSTTQPFGPYIQDPECFPINDLSGTTLNRLKTNIIIEQNFAGTFEGAISQFRMYVTPLTAPEIKHNFDLLKNTFRMFNPDCPNCENPCPPNDFTYQIIEPTTTTTTTSPITTTTTTIIPTTTTTTILTPFGLGRELSVDKRDLNYLISNKLPTPKISISERYWDDERWWGDQGNTPQCVGYAWSHWIDDGPIIHAGKRPNVNPTTLYRESQKRDQWPGENYNGTSVRGGAKYLQEIGKIKSYLWAFDVQTLMNTVLTQGPVVVGTNWYYNMFFPDRNGLIRASGRWMGGHAYVINGVNTKTQLFRIKNSWGRNWGQRGRAFISFSDMTRLIREGGEICLGTENKF